MERDPLRLAWTAARVRHLAAGLLLAMAGFLLFIGLCWVQAIIDGALLGHPPALFWIFFGLDLPEFLRTVPPSPGAASDPARALLMMLAGLAAIPVLIALLLLAAGRIAAGIGARVLVRVRKAILDAILNAPPAAREEAAQAASYAGKALSRESTLLGSAVLIPLRSCGTIALAVIFTALIDWRTALVLSGALLLSGTLSALRLTNRFRLDQAHAAVAASVELSLADLLRRLPAVRIHGAGSFERKRLSYDLTHEHRAIETEERRFALVDALTSATLLLTPAAVLAAVAWLGIGMAHTPFATMLAAVLASWSIGEIVRWQRFVHRTRPLLAEIAQMLNQLQAHRRRDDTAPLPRVGTLVAKGVSAYDPTGGRISGIDISLTFPGHVAVVGDGAAGTRLFASLIGGQLNPSAGRLTYGGIDLAKADPAERTRRIAFAGGKTILVPGTLRQNLLYGCPSHEPDLGARLTEAVSVAGLDRPVHARGLSGTLDPAEDPKLAAAIVEARRSVRTALANSGLDRFVDPFDVRRYNHHATVGENLLFGKPIGDTFSEANLASHPFVRAIVEANELTKPLAAMGLSVATSMIEIFIDVPDGHPLFERFSFFSAVDRAYFEDLVERRAKNKRGSEAARDQERLIGLALRYSESRHRLGLIDDGLRARLLAARADFAKILPLSLQPAIEFYHENRLCRTASIQDNLLFGRIASDQAGAEAAVYAVIRRVLTEHGLDDEISRIGLETTLDIRGDDLTSSEIAAIDLVRCLVRRPDVLVIERALDGLSNEAADALTARLRQALVGRGLVLVASNLSAAMDSPPFDAVIRFERGVPHLEDRRVQRPAPASA